ncbi:ankyrin repeat-containing domain protein [Xylaria sp. FL0043]|nr:ankyrin repeat-containing domain protein [Xylaria sp. FL0043]
MADNLFALTSIDTQREKRKAQNRIAQRNHRKSNSNVIFVVHPLSQLGSRQKASFGGRTSSVSIATHQDLLPTPSDDSVLSNFDSQQPTPEPHQNVDERSNAPSSVSGLNFSEEISSCLRSLEKDAFQSSSNSIVQFDDTGSEMIKGVGYLMGRTALHIACKKGHTGIAAFLLANGADANAFDDVGRTPLHWAAESGHLEILASLLDHGANTELMDGLGFRAIHIAVESGQEEFVKGLVMGGADPNSRSWG